MSRSSHGPIMRDRAWHLLKAIVNYANASANGELDKRTVLARGSKICWRDGNADSRQIIVDGVTKQTLSELTKWAAPEARLTERQVLETLTEFKEFLEPVNLFTDNRASTKGGEGLWRFTLNLWFEEADDTSHQQFNEKWAECRDAQGIKGYIPEANVAFAQESQQAVTTPASPLPDSGSKASIEQSVGHQYGGAVIAQVNGSVNIYSAPQPDPSPEACSADSETLSQPMQNPEARPAIPQPAKIFISYKRGVTSDEALALELYDALKGSHDVFIDQAMLVGTPWVEQIRREIFQAHVLIVLLSEHSVQSQMVKEEIEQARMSADVRQGFPVILPVRIAYRLPFPYPLSEFINPLHWAFWDSEVDTPRLIQEITSAITGQRLPVDTEAAKQRLLQQTSGATLSPPDPMAQPPAEQTAFSLPLELPEGTMDAESQFYIQRAEDATALSTIGRQGVTVTIKGPRQMGKSSLLIRTMAAARELDKRVVFLDFQLLGKAVLADDNLFYRRFCEYLTRKLRRKSRVEEWWQEQGASGNPLCCTDYVQNLLEELAEPVMLAMDEVENLFSAEFRSDFFSMLRAWHNARAYEPIWSQLDLVLVTSTEPYQLIQDLNQSPFNVGEVLDLEDFSAEAVAESNRRHGSPLSKAEVQTLMEWLHGHPYLVRKALYLVASGQMSAADVFARATDDRGPFGDHLRYHLFRMYDKPNLVRGLLQSIRRQTCPDKNVFFRLRGAGLVREVGDQVVPRCKLYAEYFKEHLRE